MPELNSHRNVRLPDRPVKPIPYSDSVDGDKAVLCLDCRAVWDIRAEACPRCSSKACLHIIRALDRRSQKEVRLVTADVDRLERLAKEESAHD